MSMGKRKRDRQPTMWVPTTDLPTAASHPFYRRLNQLLREHGFDDFVEAQCAGFYAETMGRPGLPPGIYFRLLLIGYFEGIDAERGIAWRAADSLALRDFLGIGLDQAPPDHSTISRTRRLIALETHRAVFTWILQCLSTAGLVKGKTIGIDATTLEANAALRSIVRRDSGESYEEFLTKLAKASGIGTSTRADLARIDRKRKKKGSNDDWTHPHDPDAKITKMKDGRTHLAHKAEHAIDLDTGAIVGVTVQGADEGDTTTIQETLPEAAKQLEAVAAVTEDAVAVIEEVVADKGYHSRTTVHDLETLEIRTYISEPDRGPQSWDGPRGGTGRGLRESTAHPRRPRKAAPPPTRRIARAAVCASLRDGWTPPSARAWARKCCWFIFGQCFANGFEHFLDRDGPLFVSPGWHRAPRPRVSTRAHGRNSPLYRQSTSVGSSRRDESANPIRI
jgi:transposase